MIGVALDEKFSKTWVSRVGVFDIHHARNLTIFGFPKPNMIIKKM